MVFFAAARQRCSTTWRAVIATVRTSLKFWAQINHSDTNLSSRYRISREMLFGLKNKGSP